MECEMWIWNQPVAEMQDKVSATEGSWMLDWLWLVKCGFYHAPRAGRLAANRNDGVGFWDKSGNKLHNVAHNERESSHVRFCFVLFCFEKEKDKEGLG